MNKSIISKNILHLYRINVDLVEKAKVAMVGEIRERKDGKYIKSPTGWERLRLGEKNFTSTKEIGRDRYNNNQKEISFDKTNTNTTFNKLHDFFKHNSFNIKDISFARTTKSSYMKVEDNKGNSLDIRISNHTKPDSSDNSLDVIIYKDNTISIDIDTSLGYSTGDIIHIALNIDKLQDFANKLQPIVKEDLKKLILNHDDITQFNNEKLKLYNKYIHSEDTLSEVKSKIINSIVNDLNIHDKEINQLLEDKKNIFNQKDHLSINEYRHDNGIVINTNNSKTAWRWGSKYPVELSGKNNRKKRQSLIQEAKEELINKINNGEF